MDESFKAMDKAIRETDIMDASYFWRVTGAFIGGDISMSEWDKKLGDNICEHLTKHIMEKLEKEGKI